MNEGRFTPDGFRPNRKAKILSGELEEEIRGRRSRLMRFEPCAFATDPIVHEFREEVYVTEREFFGIGEIDRLAPYFPQHTYRCRPPGVVHGRFQSDTGCVLLDIRYFDPDESKP